MAQTVFIIVSDGDNSYRIPSSLEDKFNIDCVCPYHDQSSDEWYKWCDRFDELYSQYKI